MSTPPTASEIRTRPVSGSGARSQSSRSRSRRRRRYRNENRAPSRAASTPSYSVYSSHNDGFPRNLTDPWEGDNTDTPPAYSSVDSSASSLINLAALDGTRSVPTSHTARNVNREIENSDGPTHLNTAPRVSPRRSRSSRSSSRGTNIPRPRSVPVLGGGPHPPLQISAGYSSAPPTASSSSPSSDFLSTESGSGDIPSLDDITGVISPPPLGQTPIFVGFPIQVLKQLPMYHFSNLSYSSPVAPYPGVCSIAYTLWQKTSIDFFDWQDVNYNVIVDFVTRLCNSGVLDLASFSLVFYTPYNLDLARITHLFSGNLSIDDMVFCFPPLDKAFGTLKTSDSSSVDWFHCSEGPNLTLKPGCYSQTNVDGVLQTPRVCEWSSAWFDTRFLGNESFYGLVPMSGCSGDLFSNNSLESANFDFQFYCVFRPILGAMHLSSIDGFLTVNSLRESKFGVGTQVSIHNGIIVPSFITFTQFVCCTQNNFMTRTLGTIIKSQLMSSPMQSLVLVSNDTYVEDLRIIAYERIQNLSRQFLRNSGAISRCQDYIERFLAMWHTFPGGWFDQRELYRNWNSSVMRTYGTSQRLGSIVDTKSWYSYFKTISTFAMFMLMYRYTRIRKVPFFRI